MNDAQTEEKDETSPELDGANALTPKQEKALIALISHPTLKEAAHACGLSETTLWRYMKDQTFAQRVREARQQAMLHLGMRLQEGSSEAATVLRNLMMSEETPASTRVTACRTIIDYAVRTAELEEIKSRVEELEEFMRLKQEGDALDSARKSDA